jgi:uncharacterized protein
MRCSVIFFVAPNAVASMIPSFPNFKVLELSDRDEVMSHTSKFLPYCDYVFVSLYAWNTVNKTEVSVLNGNLAILMKSYLDDSRRVTFIGDNEHEATARTLLKYARTEGHATVLSHIPEDVVHALRATSLNIKEDTDNHDYVYSLESLAGMHGNALMSKRGRIHKYHALYPHCRTVFTMQMTNAMREDILQVVQTWAERKHEAGKDAHEEHEMAAIARLCHMPKAAHVFVYACVYDGEKMIAFSIDEVLSSGYSVCHFWKADTNYVGIFDMLMQEKAKHLLTHGSTHINYEQDLGLESLRRAKQSYRPSHMLKKYTVNLNKRDTLLHFVMKTWQMMLQYTHAR